MLLGNSGTCVKTKYVGRCVWRPACSIRFFRRSLLPNGRIFFFVLAETSCDSDDETARVRSNRRKNCVIRLTELVPLNRTARRRG